MFYNMDLLTSLPDDLIQAIASDIPTTTDLFSLSLVNKCTRACLTDPVLFKWRLQKNRWDVDLWEKSCGLTRCQNNGNRWFRIGYIHDRTRQLFDEAVDGAIPPWVGGSGKPAETSVITLRWLEDLGSVLPVVLIHHTSNNIPQLTKVEYWPVWNILFQSLDELCSQSSFPNVTSSLGQIHQLADDTLQLLALSVGAVFHRLDRQHLSEMLGKRLLDSALCKVIQNRTGEPSSIIFSALVPIQNHHCALMCRRFSSVLLASSILRMMMISEIHQRDRDSNGENDTFVEVLPPSPTNDKLAPQIADFDWADVIPQRQRGFTYRSFSPLEALTAEETPWLGYHTTHGYPSGICFDPLMRMTLKRVTTDEIVVFEGSGSDDEGTFSLRGRIDLERGALEAEKVYHNQSLKCNWTGFVTPFGLVGRWGKAWGGWWWIWPAEPS